MKRTLMVLISLLLLLAHQPAGRAQQIPFFGELLGRIEEYNQLYTEKKRAGKNLAAIEPLRPRAEEAFKKGDIPGLLEILSEGLTILRGKSWDEKEKFITSLLIEPDRLVLERNIDFQISIARMFPANVDKVFSALPTATLEIVPAYNTSNEKSSPLVIAKQLTLGEVNAVANARVNLPDGAYWIVANIFAGEQKVGETRKLIFTINGFERRIAALAQRIAAIKASGNAKIKAIIPHLATAEFQLQRLAPLATTRSEVELYPTDQLEEIADTLNELENGRNPYAEEDGEIERAYRATDGKLIPYRVYVPENYDGKSARPLVILLHGAMGDERTYFNGTYDPAIIKSEADKRGVILVAPNGRGRFSGYVGLAAEDTFEVINCVMRDYRIDASRIYLTGHSMGGSGVWSVAAAKPELFAAIAPVAGGGVAQASARNQIFDKIKSLPIFITHGAKDTIVPAARSREMFEAAKKAGLKVNYTEVADADHVLIVGATFAAILDFFERHSKP